MSKAVQGIFRAIANLASPFVRAGRDTSTHTEEHIGELAGLREEIAQLRAGRRQP